MATIEAVESCLIREWDMLVAGLGNSDCEIIWQAHSDLASTMAYLLNFFQESDPYWGDFGGDDLLDASYEFPSPLQMTAAGLMCWGNGEHVYLSPFAGEFERDATKEQLKDFVLYFAAAGPDGVKFTIPYTRDEKVRQQLFESRPTSPEDWPHVYRRALLPTRKTGAL